MSLVLVYVISLKCSIKQTKKSISIYIFPAEIVTFYIFLRKLYFSFLNYWLCVYVQFCLWKTKVEGTVFLLKHDSKIEMSLQEEKKEKHSSCNTELQVSLMNQSPKVV